MAASSKEKRAWLVANGHPELEGGVGRLADGMLAEYDAAHRPAPADDYGPGAGPLDFVAADDPPDEYPGDPGGWPQDAPAAMDDAGPVIAEEPPSRPKRQPFRLPWHPRPAAGRPARRVRTFARVSVAPMIESTYTDIAWAAGAFPPLQKLLYAQAPIAGAVLDPAVKGTALDRTLLQPVARNYERGQVGLALVGTAVTLMAAYSTAPQPVMVDGVVQWQAVVDDDNQPVMAEDGQTPLMVMRMTQPSFQHQTAIVGLRYCVRAMADVSAGALDRVQQRAEENAARDDQVDRFMAYLLGQPPPPDPAESARGEGAAAALGLAGGPGG